MGRARLYSIAFSLALICMVAGSAFGDSLIGNYPVGTVVNGALKMPYIKVPMPTGPWTVISATQSPNNNGQTVGTIYLAQILSGKFIGYAMISSNADLSRTGWVTLQECRRTDMLFVEHAADSSLTEGCWWINHIRMAGENESNEGRRIFSFAAEEHSRVPLNLIEVGTRITDRSTFLTARWRFNPELDGIAPPKSELWVTSEFNKNQIMHYPERVRYVEKLKEFGREWYPLVRKGFAGKLPEIAQYPSPHSDVVEALASPSNAPVTVADQPTVEERLKRLKSLLDKGLISESEYDQKRHDILSGI